MGSRTYAQGSIVRASVGASRRWYAELVKSGRDLNGVTRTPQMLRRRAGLFEGRPVKMLTKVDADGRPIYDHQGDEEKYGREVANVVGTLHGVRYDESAFQGEGGLVGELLVMAGVKDADELQARLASLETDGALAERPFRLSLSGYGTRDRAGVEELQEIDSVDVVTFPAAEGLIGQRLAAAREGGGAMKDRIKKLLAALRAKVAGAVDGVPDNVATEYALGRHVASKVRGNAVLAQACATAFALPADHKLAAEGETDVLDGVMAMLGKIETPEESIEGARPATAAAPAAPAPAPAPAPTKAGAAPGAADTETRLAAALRDAEVRESRARLRDACEAAKLPAYATTRLMASYEGQVVSGTEATRLATEKATEIDEITRRTATSRGVTIVEEKQERLTASLACLFSDKVEKPKGLDPRRHFSHSLHFFMEDQFGIDLRRARMGRMERQRIKAAVDATNFDAVFADSLNRALLAEYVGGDEATAEWRKIANVVSESDFRTKEVIAPTYYGTIPDVAEGAAYTYATTPTDRKESYALSKRGILETITWEKMLNDDLGIWQSMLRRLALAFREELNDRVFQKIRRATQPTMADGNKLTSTSRTPVNENTLNLTADATGWDNLMTSTTGMMAQTGGGGRKKSVRPSFIVYPLAKSRVVATLFSDFSPAAADFPTRRGFELLGMGMPQPVLDIEASDANDWFLMASPGNAEVIRVAFLGGQEEPELIVADGQSFGSMFTNDRIEVKGRHAYAVAAVDFVGIYGNNASA